MLSTEDNELLCRVGPGTPMGAFMREYWMPAFLANELPEADGAPMRLRLLGENLIAFRTTSGKFGLVANACPHRGAVLFFGRNEEEGLRCVYHGWKFDTTATCVDMPIGAGRVGLQDQGPGGAPTRRIERNGIVWAYMGPRDSAAAAAGAGCRIWTRTARSGCDCRSRNYMQALEGDIDTVHAYLPARRPRSAPRSRCRAAPSTTSRSSATLASWRRSTRSARPTPRCATPSQAPSTGAWATTCCRSTR